MLVCEEAKCYGAETNIWQIVAYCGIIHKARKLAGRFNSTVYGFVTNSAAWQFVRIDNKSTVWTSSDLDNFQIIRERFRTIEIGDKSEDESREEEDEAQDKKGEVVEDRTDLVGSMDKLKISFRDN
ncbi:hypothetical protein BDK51DRAFT_25694 [Blyttiomyces helicus]|uniref:Uncharacterized protein n=1 Tax=Blyttiomyces helicus TaxID=388810 RepID=A0A4P9WBR3_9FUNG|nr:hypothetical protein BDK51DRAFT_25694 [Blyttiomyces helicus]|eukprot:RKO89065.1 hypothetical protein BDK51DRAFT_25694 [Blyttiomyces helicus]